MRKPFFSEKKVFQYLSQDEVQKMSEYEGKPSPWPSLWKSPLNFMLGMKYDHSEKWVF